ncbi:methyltransferase domain-containing protein [Kineococcus sp. R8]|nr:methyltransferase domain-containing protein [Kineococcus siccus]
MKGSAQRDAGSACVTGADVVACDLAPELFADGRRRDADAGVDVTWVEADAEDLPFGDGEPDAVISCVGVVFAPHHAAAAAELLRVCRPGGTLALLSWTPAGLVGQLFATMGPYAPPPPAGAQPPPRWGEEAHVRGLPGDGAEVLTAERRTLHVEHPGRVAALGAALDDLAARCTGEDGAMEREYLLLTARRRGAPATS